MQTKQLHITALWLKAVGDANSNVTSLKSILLKPIDNENVAVSVSFPAKNSGINMKPFIFFHIAKKEEVSDNIM